MKGALVVCSLCGAMWETYGHDPRGIGAWGFYVGHRGHATCRVFPEAWGNKFFSKVLDNVKGVW